MAIFSILTFPRGQTLDKIWKEMEECGNSWEFLGGCGRLWKYWEYLEYLGCTGILRKCVEVCGCVRGVWVLRDSGEMKKCVANFN